MTLYSHDIRGPIEGLAKAFHAIAKAIAERPEPVTYNIIVNTTKELDPEAIAKAVSRASARKPGTGPR